MKLNLNPFVFGSGGVFPGVGFTNCGLGLGVGFSTTNASAFSAEYAFTKSSAPKIVSLSILSSFAIIEFTKSLFAALLVNFFEFAIMFTGADILTGNKYIDFLLLCNLIIYMEFHLVVLDQNSFL